MRKLNATFMLLLLVTLCSTAFASSGRVTEADSLISADHTKTYTLPSVAGTSKVMVSNGLVAETPSGTINGSNTSFTLANTPGASASLILYQDGIVLIPTTDYSLSGTTITMVVAPAVGQTLQVTYSKF